jgi:H+/gluconate symporter-like permease
MWAQPITVAFQQKDISIFTTSSTSTSLSATASSSTTSSGTSALGSVPPTTSPTQTQTPTPTPGISTGAIAGIVVGAVALLALAIGASLFFRRKRSQSSRHSDTVELHNAQEGHFVDTKPGYTPGDPSWDSSMHKHPVELQPDAAVELPSHRTSRRHELP